VSDVGEETGRRAWKMSKEDEEEEERYSSQGASRSYTIQLNWNIFSTTEEFVLATQILMK